MMMEPVTRSTVTGQVVKQLVGLISSRVVGPGERLPSERDLMEDLSVGRSSLREALRALTLVGLLETKPGSGTYVTQDMSNFFIEQIEWIAFLGTNELEELYEVRTPLEIHSAALAAERASPQHLLELERCIQELKSCGDDIDREVSIDLAFHTIIAQAAGNRVLLRLISSLRSMLSETIHLTARRTQEKASTVEEHNAVYEAVRAKDPNAAREAMARHLQVSKQLAVAGVREHS